ncbi:MAG: hypothetical protein AB1458_05315 [Bacteroidota bacterium]
MKNLWNRISVIGYSRLRDEQDARQLGLLNRIAFLSAIVLLSLIPVGIYFRQILVTVYVCIGVVLCLCTLYFNARGLFRFARMYYFFISLAFITIVVLINGKDSGSQITFVLLGALHLVLFRESRYPLLVLAGVIALFGATCYWVETRGALLDVIEYSVKRSAFYINILCNIVLVFSVVLYFKNTAAEYESKLLQTNDEITQKNKDITDSIRYARRIQQSLLPSDNYIEKNLNRLNRSDEHE